MQQHDIRLAFVTGLHKGSCQQNGWQGMVEQAKRYQLRYRKYMCRVYENVARGYPQPVLRKDVVQDEHHKH